MLAVTSDQKTSKIVDGVIRERSSSLRARNKTRNYLVLPFCRFFLFYSFTSITVNIEKVSL